MRGAVVAALIAAAPVAAQTPPAVPVGSIAPELAARGRALVPILAGGSDDGYFADSFRRAVPATTLAQVFASMRTTLGQPRSIERWEAVTARSAMLTVRYDRGSATVRLAIEPTAPYRVTGLLVTGSTVANDSFAAIDAAAAALPGQVAVGVYALDGPAPAPIYVRDADTPVPLASAFKLWVLAEAARQVASGARHWSDVVPLGPPSLPTGILQRWPAGTPLTLQSLATLMVSISDNTATDTLMAGLGRRAVDAMAAAHGGSVPVPTTRELFALKADPALTAAWVRATTAGRRLLLARAAGRIAAAPLDAAMFEAGPRAADTVEWFAAPAATAGLLDDLRRDGVAAAILAVNPGTDPVTTARFAYVGFKGGSEPGVLTLNFVVRTKAGHWFAVTTAWHDPVGKVEEATLSALAARALALVADR